MDIQVINHTNYTEFVVSGKMYVADATTLRNLMLENEQSPISFVIDLSDLDYIDSSGLGLFVSFHKKALTTNGSFKIKGLHGDVRKLFELTRLHLVFDLQD